MEVRYQSHIVRMVAECVRRIKPSCFRFAGALLLVWLAVLAMPTLGETPKHQFKILFLYFADKDAPGFLRFQDGLRSAIESDLNAPVSMYEESFDEGWLGQRSSYEERMESYLREKYAQRSVDVIVAIGDYPLRFLQSRRKKLLPNASVLYVFLGKTARKPTPGTTGMVIGGSLVPTIQIALSQNPGIRHVLLISGATILDRALVQTELPSALKYLQDSRINVDLRVLAPATYADTRKTMAALPPDTVSIFYSYYGDAAGEGFIPARILSTLSEVTNRPMYGVIDVNMGRGIIGGSLIDTEGNGVAFAKLVERVLRGENPDAIPEINCAPPKVMFDWREMKRWGIPMNTIPSGSIVINREYTFWERYKGRIIAVSGVIFFETLLIISLVYLIANLKRYVKRLAYRRKMESLVSECAATFINLPPSLINSEIENSFQRILEYLDFDRINLFEILPETTQLHLLCSRSAENVPPPVDVIDLRHLPWTAEQYLQGIPIQGSSIDDLPTEALPLKNFMKAGNIGSFAGFPLQRDGRTFGVLSFTTVGRQRVLDPDLVLTLKTIADIFGNALKRKQAEESERESQSRLTGIVESAMDAVIAIDDEQRVVVFNGAAEKMFGCSAAEAVGQQLERFIPHRFRALHNEHIRRFRATGETRRAIGHLASLAALRSNGEEFPIEVSLSHTKVGEGHQYTAIIRDVTERERAAQQLRDSHELNLAILDSLRIHLAVLDANGTIIAATASGPESTVVGGTKVLDLRVGDNYLELCKGAASTGDRNAKKALEGIESVHSSRCPFFEMEYEYESGDDQNWFLMTVSPLKARGNGMVISHEDITERKRHENAIHELSGRLISAREEERTRIARDLHDDINQQVAILAIELQQLQKHIGASSPEGRQKIQSLWEMTYKLSKDIQSLSHQLHSVKLEHLGLTSALRSLCEEFSTEDKIEAVCEFRHVPKLDSEVSLALFRVAQESLHNVAKHSHAHRVRLELFRADEQITMRVSDDGVGFNPESVGLHVGLGMISMSERLRLVGGTLSVHSAPSLGTQVEAAIPISRKTAAHGRPTKPASLAAKAQ